MEDKELRKHHVEDANLSWFHVACTLGNGNLKIFVNGEEKATKKANGNIVTSTSEVMIGHDGGIFGNYLNGRIFDFNMFRKTLDEVSIQSIMKEGGARIQ